MKPLCRVGVCWFVLSVSLVDGQTLAPASTAPNRFPSGIPAELRPVMEAVGDRFLTGGKERITMTGNLIVGSSAPRAVTITHEMPRKFLFQELNGTAGVSTLGRRLSIYKSMG